MTNKIIAHIHSLTDMTFTTIGKTVYCDGCCQDLTVHFCVDCSQYQCPACVGYEICPICEKEGCRDCLDGQECIFCTWKVCHDCIGTWQCQQCKESYAKCPDCKSPAAERICHNCSDPIDFSVMPIMYRLPKQESPSAGE